MKRSIFAATISLALAPAAAWAGDDHNHKHGDTKNEAKAAASYSAMAEGEVRKIDKDTKKITLKHGEIKTLDMPPMTMVFQVPNAVLLDKVKAGDKVKFKADKTSSGYAVTDIEVVK
jgi:Cu/Ag efflux protein CusF